MDGKPSSSSMSRNFPLLRGDRSYQIHLSGAFILLSIISSASIALITGRVTIFYHDYVNASLPLPPNPQRQLEAEAKVQLHIIPDSDSKTECSEVVVTEDETTVKEKVNYEALVHPAMITHPNPKRVMIIESREKVDTSPFKLEVQKHTSVQEIVVISENEKDELDEVAGSGLFDVIIEAVPVTIVTGRSHISKLLFNCLEDKGILVLNFDKTTTHTGQDLGYLEVTDEMEKIGYESIHLYEDDINDFGTRREFLVAFKAFASRADWYSNESEIHIRLHRRINNSDLNFFDAPTMLKYQIPSKAIETAYCQGQGGDNVRKEDCKKFRGLNPQLSNMPISDFSVGQSGMGEHSGRGLFATKDIKEGQAIGLEKSSLSYFILPSTHQIIEEMCDWADQYDGEAYAYEVLKSISAVEAFKTGYGFWSTELGRAHSTVDSGAMMFCNHGCNGTYNFGRVTGFTEANVDLKEPPESIFRKPRAFDPVTERNMRQDLSSMSSTNRAMKQGEELLCDYLSYVGSAQYWEEDIASLRGQCDGSEVGDISSYESMQARS
mmetsp:Transcript_12306/g.18875  ORF Transcript_12306/g.18875 Transcript_12306/m.18875 type:complete len:550 (+) Transcript_12306:162-1811(+)